MWHPTIPHLLAFSLRSSYWSHDGFDILDEPDTEFNLPGGGYNAPSNRRGGPSTSKFGCEYASQLYVYEGLGRGVLNNALNGFVSTIRAAVSPAATALCDRAKLRHASMFAALLVVRIAASSHTARPEPASRTPSSATAQTRASCPRCATRSSSGRRTSRLPARPSWRSPFR